MRSWTIVRSFVVGLASVVTGVSHADLVVHYTFDGNAQDSSGNAIHATVVGAALAPDRFGAPDKAYAFDGVDDYLVAAASQLPTNQRTVAFWFNCADVDVHPVMLGYGGSGCGDSFFTGLNATNQPFPGTFYVTTHCNANNMTASYGRAPVNEWMHYAFTNGPEGSRIYVNGGIAVLGANQFFTAVAGTELAIGVNVGPSGLAPYTDVNVGWFKGSIDDVRIYDSALSEAEIAELAADNCPADFDGNGLVDGSDLGSLLGEWGSPGAADFNNDGTVDGDDLGTLLGLWGPC